MTTDLAFAWLAILLLGAWHGINPGMGWLFAVALGMQEQRGRAVLRALLPLALGHALAVAAALLLGLLLGLVLPRRALQWTVAVLLLAFGVYRLFSHRHPRWGGMRVGAKDLTIWSFLMASAHGAGLMVLPFVLADPTASPPQESRALASAHAHAMHGVGFAGSGTTLLTDAQPKPLGHVGHGAGHLAAVADGPLLALLASGVHTLSYLLVTAGIAVLVFRWLGLRLLQRLWINLDLLWAGALIATALLTPLL